MTAIPPPDFQFKQFSIWHHMCGMKVSMDAVMLGAWTGVTPSVNRVLDIGCGSGILSLMLAQRLASLNTEFKILGLDINEDAVTQSNFNALQSPWSMQLSFKHQDISSWQTSAKFDLIICNPPYFSNHLGSTNSKRHIARHNDELSFPQLLSQAYALLSDSGEFNVILPCSEWDNFKYHASASNWFVKQQCVVTTATNKAPSRVMVCLIKQPSTMQIDELLVRGSNNNYTAAFKSLTEEFYLKF